MSNLFLQNSLNNIFDTITETNTELPQWINIIDINKNNLKGGSKNNNVTDSATSSAFMGQFGGAVDSATSSVFMGQSGGAVDSATSSVFMGQFGGAVDSATSSAFINNSEPDKQHGGAVDSATSSAFMGQFGGAINSVTSSDFVNLKKSKKQKGGSNQDINKLVSMLTSESANEKLNHLSETTTEILEAQLREILSQDGGSKKHTKNKIQTAGSNVVDIKNFFTNLKSQGVDVNVKLNDKTLSDFFNLAQNTTTEISDFNANNIIGGGKKASKKSKKISEPMDGGGKKASKKSKKISEPMDGGAGTNAGFQAFLDFKKHVAEKLKISNGPASAKIAGYVNTEMKKKHSDLSAVEIAKKNAEHFDKNIDKIKSEFKELIQKSSKK